MEKGGGKSGGIQTHVCEYVGDFKKMREVGVARAAELVTVSLGGDFIGAPHHPGILGGAIGAELGQQLVQAGIEFALGAVAVKMERQIAGRRHSLFYARRTIGCDSGPRRERKKGILADALIEKTAKRLRCLRLFGTLLLDFLDLVDQVVGLLQQRFALFIAFHHIGLAAVKQIQIGEGIVVIGLDGSGLLKRGDSFLDQRAGFVHVLGANTGRKRRIVTHLFFDIVLVVVHAQLLIVALRENPIDYSDPIIRFWIVRLQLNVLLVIALGFLEFLGIKRLAAHVVKNRADAVDGRNIIRVFIQDFFEFLDCLIAARDVLLGRRAR